MRTALVMVIALLGCGRVGFTEHNDAANSDGGGNDGEPIAVPSLVQIESRANFASGEPTTIAASRAGTLLVVAININSLTSTVASVTDNAGNTYVSANVLSSSPGNPGGEGLSEIWYAANSSAGATDVTVTSVGAASLWDVTVLEIADIAAQDPVDVTATIVQPGTTSAGTGVPVTTTRANAAIVVLNSCSRLSGLVAGSPFLKLTTGANDDIAYLIGAHPAGMYQADWTCSMPCGPYNNSVVAFHAR